MSRNDASLVTGLSSANSRRLAAQDERRKLEKERTAVKLKPEAEIIFEEIKKLRNEIIDEARQTIHVEMKEADVKAVVAGAKWADAKLVSLHNRLNVKLKRPTHE